MPDPTLTDLAKAQWDTPAPNSNDDYAGDFGGIPASTANVGAAAVDSIKLAGEVDKKLALARLSHEPGEAAAAEAALTPAEQKAREAQLARQADVQSTATTAANEAAVPTALKLPLMAAQGVGKAVTQAMGAIGVNAADVNTLGTADIPNVGGTVGQITSTITQNLVGFKGASLALKGAGVLQGASTLIKGAAEGAGAAAVFDPYAERLSNIVDQHSSLAGPVARVLAANPNDPTALAYLKSAVENSVVGAAGEAFISLVTGMRNAKAAATPAQATKILAETDVKMEQAFAAKPAPSLAEGNPVKEMQAVTPFDASAVLPEDLKNSIIEQATTDNSILSHTGQPGGLPDKFLNLNRMESPEQTLKTLNALSEQMLPNIKGKFNEIQTNEMTAKLADTLGQDPKDVWQMLASDVQHTDELNARVVMYTSHMQSMATEVSDLMTKVQNGIGDPKLLDESMQRFSQFIAATAKVKRGVARGLQAGTVRTLDTLSPAERQAVIMAGGDPSMLGRILRPKTIGERLFGGYLSTWMNSLLFSARTNEANFVSNTAKAFLMPAERIAGGALTGSGEAISSGVNILVGLKRFYKDAIGMAKKSFSLEEPILDPHGSKLGTGAPVQALSSSGLGIPDNALGKGLDYAFTTMRVPMRILTTVDEGFKQLNFRASLAAELTAQGSKKGLVGDALGKYVSDMSALAFTEDGAALNRNNFDALKKVVAQVGEDSANDIVGASERSLNYAQKGTFTQDLTPGTLGHGIQTLTSNVPALKMINPFVKTPTNVIRDFGMHLPGGLNLLYKELRDDIGAGGLRKADAVGKIASAQMLWGAASMLAYQGVITGGGPKNPAVRKEGAITRPPYCFHIGGEYIPFDRVEPLSWIFGVAADVAEMGHAMPHADYQNMAAAGVIGLTKNVANSSFLKGTHDFLDVIMNLADTKNETGVSDKLKQFMLNRAASHIPQGFSDAASAVGLGDPVQREFHSMLDAMKSRIPGLSETLEPARDVLGRPIVNSRQTPLGVFNHTNWQSENNNPVDLELAKFPNAIGTTPSKIRDGRVDLLSFKNEKGQTAYDRLLELRTERQGRANLEDKLGTLFATEAYHDKPVNDPVLGSSRLDKIKKLFGKNQEHNMKVLRQEFRDAAEAGKIPASMNLDQAIKTDERNVKDAHKKVASANPLSAITDALGISQP